MIDEILDPTPRVGIDQRHVEDLIVEIIGADAATGWRPEVTVDLGAKRWRPSAVTADERHLLYVSLQQELPAYVCERLKLARAAGLRVTVGIPVGALFHPDTLQVLVEADVDVLVVDDYRKERRFVRRHCLAAMADIEVPVPPEVRRSIGLTVWSRIDEGTSQEKGRRLEALLAFLFAQVSDLKVVERNYRNASEEIDLVVQVDNFSPRVWQKPGSPFILVEAKNRSDKASQSMMSVLLTKLQTKRGSAKLGILVSLAGFTDDARTQEIRFSTQELCVVMIDGVDLRGLIDADHLDEELEVLVRRALLR